MRRIGRKRREKREEEEIVCGNADEEEQHEKDEEMRGRATDSGISRKVSAVSRRRVLGTNRFLDEPWQRNCESMAKSSSNLLRIMLRGVSGMKNALEFRDESKYFQTLR